MTGTETTITPTTGGITREGFLIEGDSGLGIKGFGGLR